MGWRSSTRRGGGRKVHAFPRKFVFLGLRRNESGMSREFCRDVPDFFCSKSLCKKIVRIFCSLSVAESLRSLEDLHLSTNQNWNHSLRTFGQTALADPFETLCKPICSPELLESRRTSPQVPRTSPEVPRRLPRKFSHCGTLQQCRGSAQASQTCPEVSQPSPEVPRTSPEVPRTSQEVSPFLWEA